MAGSNLSQLGYLMELLGVPVAELSNHLKIERTTISKWKSGARSLLETSPYFPKIVEFLAHKNQEQEQPVLVNFFGTVYSDFADSQEDLSLFIKRFLKGSEIPPAANQLMYDMKNSLYKATFSVYRGAEGRRNAVFLMLDIAENSPVPCHISIVEYDQFQWTSSPDYLNLFIQKISLLLIKGHNLEIIHFVPESNYTSNPIMFNLIPLSFYRNFKQFIISSQNQSYVGIGMYCIDSKFLAVSINSDQKPANIYTSVYYDMFTIHQMKGITEQFKCISAPFLVTNKKNDQNMIIKLIRDSNYVKEATYFAGNMLSVVTMSEPLLMEILEQNQLSPLDKERCIAFYHATKTAMHLNFYIPQSGGLFFFLNDVIAHLAYDSIIQHELSCFANGSVTMTKQQYLRHFSDTADYLTENTNIKFALTHGDGNYHTVSNAWIKRNMWSFSSNNQKEDEEHKLLFLENNVIIKMLINSIDEGWNKVPADYRNNVHTAEVLRRISRKGHP